MLVILLVLTAGLVIVLIEYKIFKKPSEKKEVVLFSTLLCIGLALNIVNGLHVKVPSLLGWLKIIYHPLYDLLISWLN